MIHVRTGTGPRLAFLPFLVFVACTGDLMPTATQEPTRNGPGEAGLARALVGAEWRADNAAGARGPRSR